MIKYVHKVDDRVGATKLILNVKRMDFEHFFILAGISHHKRTVITQMITESVFFMQLTRSRICYLSLRKWCFDLLVWAELLLDLISIFLDNFSIKRASAILSLRKPKVFALQILQRYPTKEGRVRKFFDCLYG